MAFNNSRVKQDNVLNFRLSHQLAAATDYEIEINSASNFSGTSYIQTYNGTYPANTEHDFAFTNASGLLNYNNTTYYVKARIKTADGYGSWTSDTYSFTYNSNIESIEWYQQTTPQFLTDELDGTITSTDFVTLPAPSGTPANPFTNPSFETSTGWTSFVTGGSALSAEYTNSWKTDGNRSFRFYMFGGNALSSDKGSISQTVDLTSVEQIIFDARSHYGPNMFSTLSNGGVLKLIIGGTTYATINHCASGSSSCTQQTIDKTVGILPADRIPNQIVKFEWTGFSQGNLGGALVEFAIDNIRGLSNLTKTGTITSTPFHLASIATSNPQYTELFWEQEIGGSLVLAMQHHNGTAWQNVSEFENISEPNTGSFVYDLLAMPAYDSIRIKGTLTGTSALKMFNWGLRAKSLIAVDAGEDFNVCLGNPIHCK